jgi:hypothetical protein
MLTDRHQIALDMREAGATYQAIGNVFGVSASRASAIYQRALVLSTEDKVGLSMRSARVLRSYEDGPAALADMLAADREATFVSLLRLADCGRRHAEEIIAWLDAGNRELP